MLRLGVLGIEFESKQEANRRYLTESGIWQKGREGRRDGNDEGETESESGARTRCQDCG